MTDTVEIEIAGVIIKRLSDFAVEKAVEENKDKYLDEFSSIHKSDLDRHVYEGGLKVWECAYDLASHLEEVDLKDKCVLEVCVSLVRPHLLSP